MARSDASASAGDLAVPGTVTVTAVAIVTAVVNGLVVFIHAGVGARAIVSTGHGATSMFATRRSRYCLVSGCRKRCAGDNEERSLGQQLGLALWRRCAEASWDNHVLARRQAGHSPCHLCGYRQQGAGIAVVLQASVPHRGVLWEAPAARCERMRSE